MEDHYETMLIKNEGLLENQFIRIAGLDILTYCMSYIVYKVIVNDTLHVHV